jgi:hypothetical protein
MSLQLTSLDQDFNRNHITQRPTESIDRALKLRHLQPCHEYVDTSII